MILLLLQFILATCQGLWELHLTTIDQLCNYVVARDRLQYARITPLYVADMYSLKDSDI